MKMVLLRSPQVYVWSSTTQENLTDYQGAKDSGENSFEFALISGKGSWKDNHLVHRGWEYNTPFLSVLALETPWAANGPTLCDPPAEVKGLTEEHSFLQTKGETIITAVKQKETGDDIIVRMSESYGEKSKETLFPDRGYDVFQSGLLEEQGSKLNEINLSPFEIKTVCLKKRT